MTSGLKNFLVGVGVTLGVITASNTLGYFVTKSEAESNGYSWALDKSISINNPVEYVFLNGVKAAADNYIIIEQNKPKPFDMFGPVTEGSGIYF